MVISENIKIRERAFVRTYSDEGFYILQNETGLEYSEAIDLEGSGYSYSESENKIDGNGEAGAADYEAALERFGVV